MRHTKATTHSEESSMTKRLMGTFTLALALSACAGASLHRYPHDTTHILSPLAQGAVEQNYVQVAATQVEAQYGVPQGSLVEQGVLTALDANQVCVDVTVRNIGEMRSAQVPLSSYRVFLRANQSVRDDAVVTGATQAVQPIQGTRPRDIQTGMETYCAGTDRYGNCYSWQTRPTYTTVYDPAMYDLITQQGTACFVNNGFITEETDEMEIYFVLPDRSDGVGFEWRFDIPE
jgi:hypothetical protein